MNCDCKIHTFLVTSKHVALCHRYGGCSSNKLLLELFLRNKTKGICADNIVVQMIYHRVKPMSGLVFLMTSR